MASPDEEPEPQLKYELLGGDVQDILGKEKISCMTVSEKILAIGTEQGRVHILDYSGNQVDLFGLHKARVNDLSFDKEAEHIASASNDCSVVVTNLYTKQTTRHEFRTAIKSVAIDPRPATSARRTWRDLVTGTAAGEVTLHTQGWLSRSDTPLAAASSRDAAAGGVLAIKWSGSLVAWAYDSAVTVHDTTAQQPIRTLRRHDPRSEAAAAGPAPHRSSPPPKQTAPTAAAAPTAASSSQSAPPPPLVAAAAAPGSEGIDALRRCSLLFAPDSHLYVAWSDTVLVARVWSYENNVGALSPQVELVARMKLREAVLGVSPYGNADLAVLVYPSGSPTPASTTQHSLLSQRQEQQQRQEQEPPGQKAAVPCCKGREIAGGDDAVGGAGPAPAPAPAPAASSDRPPQAAPQIGTSTSTSTTAAADGAAAGEGPGTAAAPAAVVPSEPPPPPPDPLAPGRTPQLVILGHADHREWARDSVAIPGADCCGPADYLGLMPSLPHHLHLPSTTSATAGFGTAAGGHSMAAPMGTVFAGRAGAAAATASTVAAAAAAQRPVGSSGGGGGSPSAEAASFASAGPGSVTRASGGGSGGGAADDFASGVCVADTSDASPLGSAATSTAPPPPPAPAATRRLVPVWVDGQELMFFIAAPRAIATARSRDPGDRLAWLLARRRWEEALSVVEESPQGLPKDTYDKVVGGYIEELLTQQAYDRAVELSERLLKDSAALWERWVYLFAQVRQLPKLAPQLPTENPRLSPRCYEMALQSLLPSPSDHPTLAALARRWPPGCFRLPVLADAVAGRLRRMKLEHQHQHQQQPTAAASGGSGGGVSEPGSGGDALWELLAWLYEQQGRPDLALSIHLRLKSPFVFAFVTQHGLQANLLGRAPDLFEVEERSALAMLSSHVDALPPSNVVPSLQEAMRSAPDPAAAEVWRRRLFAYLQALFAVDSSVGADYHDLQVSLTADYQPSKLMDLLVSSQYYSLEAALAICEARGLVSEQVFVLGRMGSADRALRLIIDRLGDIPRAIDFVVGQRDSELWGRLIDWALGSPATTGQLLDCIGGYVDPLLLVRRIPRGMRVERLRDRLRAIIADYRTQTSLREGCNAILRSDCRHLLAKLYDGTRRALPYVYILRPEAGGGGGGDSGEWYRCDVVHGGRMQPASPSEIPDTAAPEPHRPVGQSGPRQSSASSSPLSAAAAAAPAANPLHSEYGRSRISATNLLTSAATVPLGHAAGGNRRSGGTAGGLTRTHGVSAPSLERAAAAADDAGSAAAAAAAAAAVMEGLPWWAQSGGPDGVCGGGDGSGATHGSPSSELWVGFSLKSGRDRLGAGEDLLQAAGSRRAVPQVRMSGAAAAAAAALPGLMTTALMIPPGGGGSGGGGGRPGSLPGGGGPTSGPGSRAPRLPGSLWQHATARV